jgi:hypothetical protein
MLKITLWVVIAEPFLSDVAGKNNSPSAARRKLPGKNVGKDTKEAGESLRTEKFLPVRYSRKGNSSASILWHFTWYVFHMIRRPGGPLGQKFSAQPDADLIWKYVASDESFRRLMDTVGTLKRFDRSTTFTNCLHEDRVHFGMIIPSNFPDRQAEGS